MSYTKLRKESLVVILTVSGFANCEVVNTISIFHALWICFSALTLAIFSQFFFIFFLVIGSSCSMMLASLTLMLDSEVLLNPVFPPGWASLSLYGRCTAYFLEYSFSTLHSSEECTGPCNKHVLSAPVVLSLVETSFFVFQLPARTFLRLVG